MGRTGPGRGWLAVGALVAFALGCGDRTGLLLGPLGDVTANASSRSVSSASSLQATRTATSTTHASAVTTVTSVGTTPPSTSLFFASDPDWLSYVGNIGAFGSLSPAMGPFLGPARDVCVTSMNPASCDGGSLIYGSPNTPWAAGANLPNARWVWRADVAVDGPADLRVAAFSQGFPVGVGATGSIQIAADDMATVFADGILVGSTGSVTDYALASHAQNFVTTLDLTPALRQVGATANLLITVVGQNGPSSFGTACSPSGCTYAQNPAGVIFAGQIDW